GGSRLRPRSTLPMCAWSAARKEGTSLIATSPISHAIGENRLILRESVTAHLADSNFNHPGQIVAALEALGLSATLVDPYKKSLGPMMDRRHWIVHRADRNEIPGQGHYVARSISPTTVRKWRDAVRDFGAKVTAMLP